MQSGYGAEIQQFMVDGSLFLPPPPPPPPPPQNTNAASAKIQHHQQMFYHLQPQHQHHQAAAPPMAQHHEFSNLIHPIPIPITQQLFHHPHHQFQLFHNQQQQQQHHGLEMDQESVAVENSNSPVGSFFASAMGFKVGVNGSGGGGGGGGSRNGMNEDDGMLHGDNGDESRLHSWHREEESASAAAAAAANIKEPFWRRPLDIDYINRNNKRLLNDKSIEDDDNNNKDKSDNYSKKSKQVGLIVEHNQENQGNPAAATTDSNYKQLFSELEAIYKPGSGGRSIPNNNNNQTGSGSALTADDNPILPVCPTAIDNDHRSDTSNGTDTPSPLKNCSPKGSSSRRKQQEQLRSIAAFFDSLAKQVTDRQESLHHKFLEIMERRDQERASRDEAWRKQEAERLVLEANDRARERSLAANREASIVSFLEKITGERINLNLSEESRRGDQDCSALELYNARIGNNAIGTNVQLNTSRWPKAEVQALIRVRSGLESRFQEPGLKGPLWEEVSAKMSTIGYSRNSKRCKEKWENINKYFRKTKDSGKKRPQHSKTCPYFYQLDQFYTKCNRIPPSSSNADDDARKDNSELLDAIVISNVDHQSFKFDENEDQGIENNVAGNDHDDEEERDGEEGEGDSQDQQGYREQERIERNQHDTTFFSHQLRS